MADIATLGIKVDSSQVSSLTSSLNNATSSAANLTNALQQMNNTLKNLPNNTPNITSQTNALDKMLNSLSDQEKKLTMTRREYVQYNMSLLGATDAQKKLADAIVKNIEAIKAKEKANRDALTAEKQRVSSIQSIISGLNNEINTIGKSKAEITDYRLKLLGASDAERAHAKALAEKAQQLEEANKKSLNASNIMGKLAVKVSALAAAYFGISAIKNFANEILETAKIADNFKYSLLAVSDSAEQAAQTYQYLEKEANRLGQSITGNVDAFTGFMAAAKAANMTTEQAKKAYTGLNEAMAALHRTPAQASQALYALQQMLSTGTVRAQELNIQLGNAIPGAVPMFAQAMGKTTSELRGLMKEGLVPANEAVIMFTDYLSGKFGASAEAASNSVQGSLTKMNNAIYKLKIAIVEAMGDNTTGIIKDFTQAIKDVTEELTKPEGKAALKKYADMAYEIGKAFVWVVEKGAKFVEFFADLNLDQEGMRLEIEAPDLIPEEYFHSNQAAKRIIIKEALKLEKERQEAIKESIRYEKEFAATVLETSKDAKIAGDAFNRGWSPIVGTTAEITDKMKENEKTIKSISDKIKEQGITAGKTGIEKVRAELEAANATDEEKKSILALAAANEQKENARKNAEKAQRKAEQDAEAAIRKAEAAEKARQGRIDSIIQKLKDQIATYKQGKEVSAEVALQHENATPQIIEYAKALGRELDQMKAINKAQKEYDALMAKTAPDQVDLKRNEAIAILNEQFKDVAKNADEYKKSLKQINDYYDTKELKEYETEVSKLAETIGSLKTSSFGNEMADGINNAVISMRDLNDYLEKNKDTYDDIKKKREEAYAIANEDEREKKIKELDDLEGKYTASQLSGYRQLFGTISQLYGENTKEREALHKIEMAFAAAEIAMNLEKTISAAYVAITTQGAGDPWTAFARIAAMTALMVGIVSAAGGSLSGGGSGGGASAASSTSSSTVLGSTEGSQSISNSLDFMTDIQSKQYNELKDINTGVESLNKNITGLVTSVIRNADTASMSNIPGKTGGASYAQEAFIKYSNPLIAPAMVFSDISAELTKNIPILGDITKSINGFLNNTISDISDAIYGGSKKISIISQGLEVSTGKIGDLLEGSAVEIQKYADIVVKKTSGWLSGGGSKKTPLLIEEALNDDSIKTMFTSVFKNMGETMVAIAKNLNLGEENIEAIYAYTFDIGKIDLKGLETSEDINAALTKAINDAGDFAAIKFFQEFVGMYQQTGEALLETAIRVASEKSVVEDILSMTNQAFDNAAIPEIALATTQSIIDLAGGIKQLQESSSTYFNEFFDDGEKQKRLYSQLSGAMASINLPMAENRKAFRAMVESLDLSNEAQRQQYVTLLSLSEAADKYYDALESGEKTTKDNSDAITSMVADTQKAIDQMDMSEFDKSIQNIKENTEKSIKQLTSMGASESELAVIREYGNKQIKELTEKEEDRIKTNIRNKEVEYGVLMGVISSEEKLIMDRQAELETMDESLRPLQQLIWAREDEIAAAKKAKEIADKKFDLEIELLKLQGNEIEAVKRLREKELSALDSSLRPLQEQIWALEDAGNNALLSLTEKSKQLRQEIDKIITKGFDVYNYQQSIIESLGGITIDINASDSDFVKKINNLNSAVDIAINSVGSFYDALDLSVSKIDMNSFFKDLVKEESYSSPLQPISDFVADITARLDQLKSVTDPINEAALSIAHNLNRQQADIQYQMTALQTELKNADEAQATIIKDTIANLKNKKSEMWSLMLSDVQTEEEKKFAQIMEAQKAIESALIDFNTTAIKKVGEDVAVVLETALPESIKNSLKSSSMYDQIAAAITTVSEGNVSGFESAFTTLINLLTKGSISVDEFNAVFEYTKEVFNGTSEAIKTIAEDTEKKFSLEMQLLRLTGKESEAIKAEREKELATLSDSLKPLQERIWQLEDEKTAADKAKEAEESLKEKLKAIAEEKSSLELKIAELTLSSSEYLALSRQKELLAIDESNRSLQERIWQLEDEKTIADKLAQDEKDRIEKEKQLTESRSVLEINLLQVMGKTQEALAKQREKELATLDSSLIAIQKEIWAIEDSNAAKEAAAAIAEEEERKAKELADKKTSLLIELYTLEGKSIEATSLARQTELDNLDESLHALQKRIWALEDEKKAQEDLSRTMAEKASEIEDHLKKAFDNVISDLESKADLANKNLEDATGLLNRSFEAEQQRLVKEHESIIEKLNNDLNVAQDSLSSIQSSFEAIKSLKDNMTISISEESSFAEAQKSLYETIEKARRGDFSGIESFTENMSVLSSDNRNIYKSEIDYKRDFFKTYRSITELESLTGNQLSTQEQIVKNIQVQIESETAQHEVTIKTMNDQLDALLKVDKSIDTVDRAIQNFHLAQNTANEINNQLAAAEIERDKIDNIFQAEHTEKFNEMIVSLEKIAWNTALFISKMQDFINSTQQPQETKLEIPGYANGGMASGTYVVGERGPEMLTTPPARITSNSDIRSMLNDEDVKRILAEIKEEISRGNFNIAKNTQETAKTLKKFDYDGMPETRV